MTAQDAAGLAGVLLLIAAYAGTCLGRLDPKDFRALSANFVGASLLLSSIIQDFNLPALVLQTAWAIVAMIGLARLAGRRVL